jgi:hypothetical protein
MAKVKTGGGSREIGSRGDKKTDLREATLEVALHYHGDRGALGYALFEAVNTALFSGELPWPWITWALTAHGGCLGLTHVSESPIITLHPSILGGSEKTHPWGVPPERLGVLFALDVMIHESTHVAVEYLRGGRQGGESSHNNPAWMAEINRLAPLLGFAAVEATMSRPTRIGKTIQRAVRGNVPLAVAATFPSGLRASLGEDDTYYLAKILPFPVALPEAYAHGLAANTAV